MSAYPVRGWLGRLTLLVVCGALVSCAGRRARDDEERALRRAIELADQAWEVRGREGLDAAAEALCVVESAEGCAIPRRHRERPEVQWRRLRLFVAYALAEPEVPEARRAWARARAEGFECLATHSAVRRELRVQSWSELAPGVLSASASEPAGSSGRECARWTAVAWVRWVSWFGTEAASVDLRVLGDLLSAVEVAESLSPPGFAAQAAAFARVDRRSGLLDPTLALLWARSLYDLSRPPQLGGDPSRGRQGLEALGRRLVGDGAAGAWAVREDLQRHSRGASGTFRIDGEATMPEDLGAAARATFARRGELSPLGAAPGLMMPPEE